jgi:membrane-associated phospholipid phosphatase
MGLPPHSGESTAPAQRRATARVRDVLDAPPGSFADRIGWRARRHHPFTVGFWVALPGLVVLAALLIGLGLLLTHVLLHGPVGRWDERADEWFVAHRTPTLNAVTSVATTIGSTTTVLAIGVVAVVLLALRRLWGEIGLVVTALVIEVAVFLATTFLVERPRPAVPRLDSAPPTSSFPSGHAAAAIALWVSLALVVTAHVRNATARTLVWVIAIAVPLFVGLARLYRGMHHPTDVMASVVLGGGAVVISLLAVRAASRAADVRRAGTGESDRIDRPVRLAS